MTDLTNQVLHALSERSFGIDMTPEPETCPDCGDFLTPEHVCEVEVEDRHGDPKNDVYSFGRGWL